MATNQINPEAARYLGLYVYALIDPRGVDEIFYVGKGRNNRAFSHLNECPALGSTLDSRQQRIAEIRAAGHEPRVEIIRWKLEECDPSTAIEAALIDTLPKLTNQIKGHDVQHGRRRIEELIAEGSAPFLKANPPAPALLIRLNARSGEQPMEIEPGYFRSGSGWFSGIDDQQLYDSTRGWWRINQTTIQKKRISYAISVHQGLTLAIYSIERWLDPREADGRMAFQGTRLNDGPVFKFYFGKAGKRIPLIQHAQNPIHYWPQEDPQP